MLDDVERGAFLVQPARKHALPGSVGLGNVQLDESPGQFLILPRRGRVAGTQADNRVAYADRLARLQCQVADNAVALVEQPKHRDALAHRRDARHPLDRLWHVDRHGRGALHRLLASVGAAVAACCRRRQCKQEQGADQDYSGFHA
jgi:hypothetical protein